MRFVPNKVSRAIGKRILETKKNSPHIFFAVGVVGVVGGAVLACQATLKLEDTLDGVKKDLELVDGSLKSDEEKHRLAMAVRIRGAYRITRLYAPALAVGGAGIASLTGSHIQLTKRNTALTVTLASVMKAYEEYRARVQEEVGEERELEIYRGIGDDTVDIEGHRKKIKVTDPNAWSPYARIFDEYSRNWQKDAELNRIFLQCQQQYANHLLKARGHIFLNEVYDALGLERSRAGAVVGWVVDGDGDGYVDFGLFEATSSRFINNLEKSVILDFNVDGVVYDKIKE